MLFALGTIVFIATIWLVVVAAAAMLDQDGGKIRAALAGRSWLAGKPEFAPAPVRISARSRAVRPVRAQPRLRAAA